MSCEKDEKTNSYYNKCYCVVDINEVSYCRLSSVIDKTTFQCLLMCLFILVHGSYVFPTSLSKLVWRKTLKFSARYFCEPFSNQKASPKLKSPSANLAIQFHLHVNQAILMCINTRVCVLIRQYSTGLFVSYSISEKPNCTKLAMTSASK